MSIQQNIRVYAPWVGNLLFQAQEFLRPLTDAGFDLKMLEIEFYAITNRGETPDHRIEISTDRFDTYRRLESEILRLKDEATKNGTRDPRAARLDERLKEAWDACPYDGKRLTREEALAQAARDAQARLAASRNTSATNMTANNDTSTRDDGGNAIKDESLDGEEAIKDEDLDGGDAIKNEDLDEEGAIKDEDFEK